MINAYATPEDVAAGFRELSDAETAKCNALIVEAAVMIDAVAPGADCDRKRLVTCRMVRRQLGSGDDMPIGATQSTVSALGYSQTFGFGSGASAGEMYLGKAEKMLLGVGNKIGASNPYGGECHA